MNNLAIWKKKVYKENKKSECERNNFKYGYIRFKGPGDIP